MLTLAEPRGASVACPECGTKPLRVVQAAGRATGWCSLCRERVDHYPTIRCHALDPLGPWDWDQVAALTEATPAWSPILAIEHTARHLVGDVPRTAGRYGRFASRRLARNRGELAAAMIATLKHRGFGPETAGTAAREQAEAWGRV